MKAALTKEQILSELAARQQELKQYGVQRIGLFGSFVRNEATNESDIDLLTEFIAEKKTLKNLVHLGDFLEQLFDRKVEIVTPQSLSKYIGPYILNEVEYATFND